MENKSCPSCKKESPSSYDSCSYCKFPFSGTEDEKSKHIGIFISQRRLLDKSAEEISKSKKLLYIITAFNVLGLFLNNFDTLGLLITIVSTAVILLCAIFLEKNPKLLTIIPLGMILFIYLINFLVEPDTLLKGIMFKILIIGGLSYNLYTLYEADKFKKANNLN
ncbi:hypothetical protein [uncultured Flavobacterium sp.]|uniref:hypothetical protein n=1 Tax=uncultured Flavobacterium sp. TaxID=165435 RepID=UPI0030EFA2EB|tara:strand:+ start:20622 stop:21116 length:495 start_codon:yes stop_codon:yes gene_type:complete